MLTPFAIVRKDRYTDGGVARPCALLHNAPPHSAFQGQTPDEMYFGIGDAVPAQLAQARAAARAARIAENKARRCAVCA